MFRYILVPAPGDANDDAVFRTAVALVRPAAGHLQFLHVRPDPQQLLIAMSAGDYGGGTAIGELLDALQRDIDSRQDRARHTVQAFCADQQIALADQPRSETPTATFRVATGNEARMLTMYARTADLTVLGRTSEQQPSMMQALEALLLESGRPLLLAPAQPPAHIGRHIAIGWKDTAEAARAVAVVMPLVGTAQSVTVIAVQETPPGNTASAERLCHVLQWHNPAATLRIVAVEGGDTGETLLSAAADCGADLLVLGGYSHSRLREVVFGGVTRHVLHSALLPVLMAH